MAAVLAAATSSDLIQAGVSEQSLPPNPLLGDQYYARYEILRASETQITGCTGDANGTVNPGDSITVDCHNVRKQVERQRGRRGHWTYSDTLTSVSSESSAEWIQDVPTLVVQTISAPEKPASHRGLAADLTFQFGRRHQSHVSK